MQFFQNYEIQNKIGVYTVRNKSRISEDDRKKRKEQLRNNDDNKDPFADQKVDCHLDCVNFFNTKQYDQNSLLLDESQKLQEIIKANEKLILQNITSGKHFNRFILMESKKISELEEYYKQKKNIEAYENFKRTKRNYEVEEVKFRVGGDFMALKAQLFDKKYLRKNVNHYLKRNIFLEKENKESEFKHLPNQFTIFPMNIDLLMKLRIFQIALLYQIRDSFAIHHFQIYHLPKIMNKQYKKIEEQHKQQPQKQKIFSYQLLQNNHFICDNYSDLMDVMHKDEKYNQIVKTFPNNKEQYYKHQQAQNQIYQYPSIHECHKRYVESIRIVKLSELIKSLTSTEYSPNNDKDNLERYEFLGDTVLKCLATVEIYFTHQDEMEKGLHVRRTKIIFNKNLTLVALLKKLFKYILASKMEHQQPLGIKFEIDEKDEESQNNKQIQNQQPQLNGKNDEYHDADERQKQQNEEEPQKKANQQIKIQTKPFYRHIKSKTLADSLESLVGVFYCQNKDLSLCQFLLNAFGVLSKPDLTFNHVFEKNLRESQIKNPIYLHLRQVEDKLNYRFNNINLLIQAFTLPEFEKICSQVPNGKSQCLQNIINIENKLEKSPEIFREMREMQDKVDSFDNIKKDDIPESLKSHNLSNQRLEFLGDAVLDLIVVEYLFSKYETASPGDLTMLKTLVVQNRTLCLINLENEFYKYIIGNIQKNLPDIDKLKQDKQLFKDDICKMYNEKYNQVLIKTLGDIIESLVCAIFIDNNLNYEATKKIVLGFMKQFMEDFTTANQFLKAPQNSINQIIKDNFGEFSLKEDDEEIYDGKKKFIIQNNKGEELLETFAFDSIDALNEIFTQIERNKKQRR